MGEVLGGKTGYTPAEPRTFKRRRGWYSVAAATVRCRCQRVMEYVMCTGDKRRRWRGAVVGGFTLVELLVVIGIIALLIGILLPVLSKARQASQRTACLANIKQVGAAMVMYVDANK